MKKVIIIHGWESAPDEAWRPWLKTELMTRGYEVRVPAMPDAKHPKMDAWIECLRESIGTPNKDVTLIGHSLGAITILWYLESLKDNEIIGTAIFLAGFSTDLNYIGYNGELSEFFRSPVNFPAVKKHGSKFIVLHSTDDRWVDVDQAYILKKKLGARAIIQNNMGHYGASDNIVQLPILLDLLT